MEMESSNFFSEFLHNKVFFNEILKLFNVKNEITLQFFAHMQNLISWNFFAFANIIQIQMISNLHVFD